MVSWCGWRLHSWRAQRETLSTARCFAKDNLLTICQQQRCDLVKQHCQLLFLCYIGEIAYLSSVDFCFLGDRLTEKKVFCLDFTYQELVFTDSSCYLSAQNIIFWKNFLLSPKFCLVLIFYHFWWCVEDELLLNQKRRWIMIN